MFYVQGEAGVLRRQVGESEGEVQVMLGQLAVQTKLAVANSKELTQLHDHIRKLENQHKLVSLLSGSSFSRHVSGCAEQSNLPTKLLASSKQLIHLHCYICKLENQHRLVSMPCQLHCHKHHVKYSLL